MPLFHSPHPFPLENGAVLPGITVAYETYGSLNASRSNVVWVCHALTANAAVTEWWPGVVGQEAVISPDEYFIVCANILGSCYGSTGPLSTNPATGEPWCAQFPALTIRDMVHAHILLRKHLQLPVISLLMGGSMGGYQAMEWCVMEPGVIRKQVLLATSATESAWGIAAHTAQRMSIEADPSWQQCSPGAGASGLKAARAIGMLTYRNYQIMVQQQSDPDSSKTDDYKAASYIRYQGEKLAKRFHAQSYWLLTKSMDSHHLARGRGSDVAAVLGNMHQPTLVIGISSDILCPLAEQEFLASALPNARLAVIDSSYGHDGFLVESEKISNAIRQWLNELPASA